MSNDININESAILETLNHKIDYDGGNYKGSGLAKYVVDVSGDTMTGDLYITRANTATFHTKSTDFDYKNTTAPTSQLLIGRYVFRDKANTYTGGIENRFTTTNRVETGLTAQRQINGTNKSAQVKLGVTETGDARFEFPRCTTKATTTSSAANDKVAVVVQNYVNGTSWYRIWSDGWIEQGGTTSISVNSSATITFLKAFSNANYSFTHAHAKGSGWTNGANANYYDKAAASIKVYQCDGTGVSWYACGY